MDIYEKHSATFRNMSAYVVVKDGRRVGSIAFKDGGSAQAFVHWFGTEMIRGAANGGGYDRHSAACAAAARKAKSNGDADARAFWSALALDGGASWERELDRAGFQVWRAV